MTIPFNHRSVSVNKMTKLRLCCISAVLLIASVPWFFTEFMTVNLFGFPSWAFYSLCITLLYAIVTAVFLQRYWSLFANDDDR
jgi:hypothetical protein